MSIKLFAVCLGGRASKCNTELHDVVFAFGENIEATYEQLMDQWFGTVKGLHLDSWIELNIVDGHKVTISEHAANGLMNLYFINLGAYSDEFFGELHANCFLAAGSAKEAKARAKFLLSNALPGDLHTDDLYNIDDCIKIRSIGSHHIGVEPTIETGKMRSMNAYHVIPEAIIQGYLTRNNRLV